MRIVNPTGPFVSLVSIGRSASSPSSTSPATTPAEMIHMASLERTKARPKESDTATFNAPSQPGRYPFFCSFPGHYQVGMKGELIVE